MGRASARLFAKEGASVVLAGRNEERGYALEKEINDADGKALFVKLDIVNQQEWDDAVAHANCLRGLYPFIQFCQKIARNGFRWLILE